jgi:hypothetical protein
VKIKFCWTKIKKRATNDRRAGRRRGTKGERERSMKTKK